MSDKLKQKAFDLGERVAYVMCKRKRKLKSAEANKKASKYNQRKYHCPICGHWHLTKKRGEL